MDIGTYFSVNGTFGRNFSHWRERTFCAKMYLSLNSTPSNYPKYGKVIFQNIYWAEFDTFQDEVLCTVFHSIEVLFSKYF